MCLKRIVVLIVAALIPLSFASAEGNSVYKIGVIIPLSGPSSSIGNYAKKAMELSYSQLPPDRQRQIKLLFEDDMLTSSRAVTAFHKLKNQEGVNAVMVLGSGIGNAVGPLAESQKVLLIAVGASDKNIVKDKKFVFTHWVSPEEESRVLLDEIERRGYQRLGILTQEHEGAISVEKALLREFQNRGEADKVVYQDRVLGEERDFRTLIAKLRSQKVDGVAVLLLPGGLASFFKQARDLKLEVPIFGLELFEDQHEVEASDGAMIGSWYVNSDEPSAEFTKSYRDRYKEQAGWATQNAYDSIQLVAEAVAKFGPDNEKIADFLRTLKDYQGAAGVYSASGDNRFTLPAAVKMVTADGFKKLNPS